MAKRGPKPHPGLLTPREQDVLALLRQGLTKSPDTLKPMLNSAPGNVDLVPYTRSAPPMKAEKWKTPASWAGVFHAGASAAVLSAESRGSGESQALSRRGDRRQDQA